MEIKIEDYIERDEIKEIIKEELRESVKLSIKRNGVSTYIANIGYHNVFEIINNEIPGYEEMLKEKIKEIIGELSNFCVFRKADFVDREDSLGQKYLEQAVENNKNIINSRVIEIMQNLSKEDIAYEITEIIEEKIEKMFCSKGE